MACILNFSTWMNLFTTKSPKTCEKLKKRHSILAPEQAVVIRSGNENSLGPALKIIPNELLLHIFAHLPLRDILRAGSTCRWLYHLANDRFFLKKIIIDVYADGAQFPVPVFRDGSVSLMLKRSLGGCAHFSPTQLDLITKTFRKAKEIELADDLVNSVTLACIAKNIHTIYRLTLTVSPSRKPAINEGDIGNLLIKHPEITHLTLVHLSLSTEELTHCVSACRMLVELSIVNNPLHNKIIMVISLTQPNLRNLSLKGSMNVDGKTIKCLAKNCPQLEFLVLDGCHKVSPKVFPFLCRNLKGLSALTLQDCDRKKMRDWVQKHEESLQDHLIVEIED